MKTLTLLLLLFCTVQSNGQTKKKSAGTIDPMYIIGTSINFYDLQVKGIGYPEMYIKRGSDTLVIKTVDHLKYIQIGDRVYKIESPRLTEVEKESRNIWIDGNGGIGKISLTPSPYYIAEPYHSFDTSVFKRKP